MKEKEKKCYDEKAQIPHRRGILKHLNNFTAQLTNS